MYVRAVLLCYLDESGDEQPLRTPTDPPVLVLGGLVVDHDRVRSLTYDFLQLKKTFRPQLSRPDVKFSEVIRHEIKGSDLRRNLREGARNQKRAVLGFLDKLVELLDHTNCKIVGQVHVKGDRPLSKWIYPNSVAAIAADFEAQLRVADTQGCMIMDSRNKTKNAPSVNRMTTERFKSGGDPYPHLAESPVFGHSDAHVALQIADLLVSGLLFPMACSAYADTLIHNVHLSPGYAVLRGRYGTNLRLLEHRYTRPGGSHGGGIVVSDGLNAQPSIALFRDVPYAFKRLPGADHRL